ncbi:hypothetical protein C2E23DRAFT_888608 [Lenzites betulinus]|nr:hypothetical protein C2E23DRAFT_888608 [Lenzites betulinus]
MSDTQNITLYAAVDSPYPERVRLALEQAGAKYNVIWIDLMNKPEWYKQKVYPSRAEVPFLVYGGPELHPDEAPSPDSVKIPESLVILEFLADIFPSAQLLPSDPALRARVRLFNAAEPSLAKAFVGFFFMGNPLDTLLSALDDFQGRLPPTGFAVGEWSIADAAALPILNRLLLCLRNGYGLLTPEAVKEALDIVESPRYARLAKYVEDNLARPNVQKVWNEAAVKEKFEARMELFRKTGAVH